MVGKVEGYFAHQELIIFSKWVVCELERISMDKVLPCSRRLTGKWKKRKGFFLGFSFLVVWAVKSLARFGFVCSIIVGFTRKTWDINFRYVETLLKLRSLWIYRKLILRSKDFKHWPPRRIVNRGIQPQMFWRVSSVEDPLLWGNNLVMSKCSSIF